MYLLIMVDTLLGRPSLHFTQLHFTSLHFTQLHLTSLHSTCRYFTFPHFNFTQLHFTTLSFCLTAIKFPTAPFHLTSLHFTSLHCTFRQFSLHCYSFHFTPFIIASLTLLLKMLGLNCNVSNASASSILKYVHFSTSPKRYTDLPSKVFASFYSLHLLCNDVRLLKTAPSLMESCQQHNTNKPLQKVRYYASLHFMSYSHTHTHTHTIYVFQILTAVNRNTNFKKF
jgi:hypothetical protein